MIVKENGRTYLVRSFDGKEYQTIKFNKKRYDGSYASGTTVEELILVLKHKFLEFDKISPSEFNKDNVKLCQEMMYNCYLRLEGKKEDVNRKADNREDKTGETNTNP
jgi:hypothetical protein